MPQNFLIPAKFLKRVFTYQNGALIPFSLALSAVTARLTDEITIRIQALEAFKKIFSSEITHDLVICFLIFLVGMGMYIAVFVFDFITGMLASRKEHLILTGTTTGFVKSDKLWSSVWKFFAVIVISSILTLFSAILVIINQDVLHQGGRLLTIFFFFMVISFDLHSIGENQERRFGKKPEFYQKLDQFFKKIGDLLMLRIKKFFS